MLENLEKIIEEASNFSSSVSSEIEQYRIKYLGKKGILNEILADFQSISKEQKKDFGKKINELKTIVSEKVKNFKNENVEVNNKKVVFTDLSLPAKNLEIGSRHPISLVRNEIIEIFKKLGFSVSEGPEIEDDYHVFTALNFPPEHPARDMQDTFFIEKNPDILLRTHTSSVQVRVMENEKPPIRTISPGRVFRNEAISSRSHCIFHQVEGLYVDTDVSFADLKQTLLYFAVEMFGKETKIRLRPSFFPFTEPSAEMDISCSCGGKGCSLCKHTGWLEILGCGMVDPEVLKNNNIDPQKYTGFAFGMGIERIALLKYQINDIRLYFENDVRFLKQFSNAY